MNWLKNRSIGTKLGILSGIPLVILIIVTVFNFLNSSSTNRRFISAFDDYTMPSINVAVARVNLQATQKDVLKIVLTDDPKKIEDVHNDLAARRSETAKIYEEFSKRDLNSKEKNEITAVIATAAKLRVLQDEIIEMGSDKSKTDEAITKYFEELEPVGVQYTDAIRDLSNYLIELTANNQSESVTLSREATITSSAAALIATIVTILMSIFIARFITNPINLMKTQIARFAAGDLSVDFTDDGRDAIAQMGNELEKMAQTLRGVVESINVASSRITDSSQDFSAMAQETNASVEEFRANVDEMGTNLSSLASSSEEVNASVEEVAAGAQTTAEKGTDIARRVDDAMTAGDTGMNAVRSVVNGISRVAESSAASTSAVLELGNSARQIQSFVSQIGSIADQTNLLALNAAIEAARAGEAGRGFAVVAEEVRKLAEESNVAAKSIAELASTITTKLDTIISYAQENTSDSNKAKELSSETEQAITNMITYLRQIANATQDLAAVAEQQAASSEEIAESVQSMSTKINSTAVASENIRTSVTEVAAASEKVAEGAENLSSLSNDLQTELSYFKADEKDTRSSIKNRPQLKALPSRR
ncbi:MAG: methyl-accepting chemotaxis protein [Synergistaceae bacterium]|jgi:methyl-accepting chemotaxis protein|nr:methyl-accepting chemotaxis protein [Synergistaceae bacterium]